MADTGRNITAEVVDAPLGATVPVPTNMPIGSFNVVVTFRGISSEIIAYHIDLEVALPRNLCTGLLPNVGTRDSKQFRGCWAL